ncbi:MAG: zinc-ribbon domain-containing protein [Deltaproteobacteria bacterium]|nr:zinc-ribbon domain-containing protein [Deltaproteobacteria bacterium]
MITTCTECRARYRLDAERVPHRKIRVRCPSCRGVFVLDGTDRTAEAVQPAAAARPESRTPVRPAPEAPRPPAPAPQRPQPQPAAARTPAPAGTAVLDQPGAPRRRRTKEEMLARALVSDIKVYNRDAWERALAAGNLLDALGPEIKKSWELYKEKVTPEVAGSTEYFRDALNEILAEGRNVF